MHCYVDQRIPELIRDSIDGLLVPPSDADALASALARLMDDEQLRHRLGAAGRKRVMDKYDLGRSIVRLAEVFDAYVAEGSESSVVSEERLVSAI